METPREGPGSFAPRGHVRPRILGITLRSSFSWKLSLSTPHEASAWILHVAPATTRAVTFLWTLREGRGARAEPAPFCIPSAAHPACV